MFFIILSIIFVFHIIPSFGCSRIMFLVMQPHGVPHSPPPTLVFPLMKCEAWLGSCSTKWGAWHFSSLLHACTCVDFLPTQFTDGHSPARVAHACMGLVSVAHLTSPLLLLQRLQCSALELNQCCGIELVPATHTHILPLPHMQQGRVG